MGQTSVLAGGGFLSLQQICALAQRCCSSQEHRAQKQLPAGMGILHIKLSFLNAALLFSSFLFQVIASARMFLKHFYEMKQESKIRSHTYLITSSKSLNERASAEVGGTLGLLLYIRIPWIPLGTLLTPSSLTSRMA